VLATKLYAPRTPDSFVARPRLLEQLTNGLAGGLILVCAPAGFGKTALLADWARSRTVAWLSLDAGDNDPMRFWRHLLAAIDGVRPGTADRVLPALDLPVTISFESLVTDLINDFAEHPGPGDVALVLDDYHVIDSPAIHDSFTFLIERRPPQLDLVVASRADPPLRLARARASGQLTEVRADELRFTAEETIDLLDRLLGPEQIPAGDALNALVSRTEGWAAGLRLAALALQGRSDASAFIDAFSGGHRFVLDYLTEEVLAQQPEGVRTFLMQTSVLDRLSGPLADAVTGRDDSTAMFESIERSNLFIVPLDDVRGWWRYHHLFGELLRTQLQQHQPDQIAGLHRRAAHWYEENGMAGDAMQHALAAEDHHWAARIIEREVDGLLLRNEGVTLDRWLMALPPEVVRSRPGLLLARADLALSRGQLEAVEQALDAAERAIAAAPDDRSVPAVDDRAIFVANMPAAIAYWRAYIAELRGDAARASAFDRQALAALSDADSVLETVIRLHLSTITLLNGEVSEIEPDLETHLRVCQSAGEIYLAMRAMELLGHVQRARGRLDLALTTYRQGLEFAAVPGQPPVPAAGMAHIGLAEVAYQRGDLGSALEHARAGIALCRGMLYRRPLAAGLSIVARIRRAEGDAAAAFEVLEDDPRVAASVGVTSLLNPLPALRARLLLDQGDLERVAQWIKDRGLRPDDEVRYPREPEYLILARLLLARGRLEPTLDLLNRLHERAVAQGRFGRIIEIQVLHAVTLAAAGDERRAIASLAEALALGHPQGYVRVFADEGEPMAALLRQFVAAQRSEPAAVTGVPLSYLGRLMRAIEDDARTGSEGKRRRSGLSGLVEPLSEREREVLQLVAAGKPNRDIADELFVTLDTVKKHVTHIFQKLGAANRTEATARARDLGLLDDIASPPTAQT
jgi:LuxR family maltose regulon positive regulatory protein